MAAERNDVVINVDHIVSNLDRIQQSINEQRKLGQETETLQTEFDQLRQSLDQLSTLNAWVADLQSAEAALAKQSQTVADLTAQQQALRTEVDASSQAQAASASRYEEAAGAVDRLDVRIREHQANVARLRAEQESNRTALQNARAAYGENSEQVQQLTARDRELAEAIRAEQSAQAQANVERTSAKQTAAGLKDELGEQNRALRDSEKALSANAAESDKAARKAGALDTEIELLRAQLRAGGVDTGNLGAEQKRLAQELEQSRDAAARFGQSVDESLTQAQRASENTRVGLGALSTFFGNVLVRAAEAAKDAVVNFVRGLGEAFSENEKFERSMKRVSGSATDYARNLEVVAAVSDKLGFIDDDLAASFERLKNAGLDPASGALSDVATISKALGGEQERLTAITELLAKANEKGGLDARKLSQAAEQQVPLLEALSKTMGVSTDKVLQLAQAGDITSAQVQAAFAQLAKDMGGTAAEVDKTWADAMQRSKKAFDDFTDAATGTGLQEKVIEIFTGIGLSSEETADRVKDAGVRIGGVLQALLGPLDALAGAVRITFNGVTSAFNATVGGIATVLAKLLEVIDSTPLLGRVLRALGADADGLARSMRDVAEGAFQQVEQDGEDMLDGLAQVGRGMSTTFDGVKDTFVGLEEQSGDTAAGVAKVGEASQTTGEAARELVADAAGAGKALSGPLAAGASDASDALVKVGTAGADAGKAVETLVGNIKATSAQSLIDTAAALRQVEASGKASGAAIEQGLVAGIKKLSDTELPQLLATARDVLGTIDQKTGDGAARFEQMSGIVETLRTEALARLGVDADTVLTGIDQKARTALETFKQLVNDPDVNPQLLTDAYQKLLDTLDSPQELKTFKAMLEEVRAKGAEVGVMLEGVNAKLAAIGDTSTEAGRKVKEAFAAFGLQTRAELEATAQAAKEQFQLIQSSGQATAAGLDAAFSKMADAQLAAAVGLGDAAADSKIGFLAATAATDKQREAIVELIKKYDLHGDTARRVLAEVKSAHTDAAKEIGKEQSAIDSLNESYEKRVQLSRDAIAKDPTDPRSPIYDPRAIKPSTEGGVASAAAVDERYRQLNAEQRAEVDALFRERFDQYIAAGANGDTAGQRFSNYALRRDVTDLISSLLSGQTQPPAGRTVDININLPGFGSARVSATPDQAEALQNILQQLEAALSTYGGG